MFFKRKLPALGKYLSLFIFFSQLMSSRCEISLSDDPALFPGHLQPLGTSRPQQLVETVDKFPEPEDFFKNYVNVPKPLIVKGGAKLSPAFQLWTDEYLKNHPESMNATFDIEMGKKEDRKGNMKQLPVKEFIETYHEDDIYAVSNLPKPFRKEFLIPPPIRCSDVTDKLSMALLWFSSGGTRSVLHYDSFDNWNCLYRGSKTLLIASYQKFKGKVKIDRPNGYSAVDVDKVNFTKYPGLREVEYHRAEMEEGDCLFIPYLWYHQVNSVANKDGMNMALNVWWAHQNKTFIPKNCSIAPEDATFEKMKFRDSDMGGDAYGGGGEGESEGEEGEEDEVSPMAAIDSYNKKKNQEIITRDEFIDDLKNDQDLEVLKLNEIKNQKIFEKYANQLFEALDVDKDGDLTQEDFNFGQHGESADDPEANSPEQEDKSFIEMMRVIRKVDRYLYCKKTGKCKKKKPEQKSSSNETEAAAKPSQENNENKDESKSPKEGKDSDYAVKSSQENSKAEDKFKSPKEEL